MSLMSSLLLVSVYEIENRRPRSRKGLAGDVQNNKKCLTLSCLRNRSIISRDEVKN